MPQWKLTGLIAAIIGVGLVVIAGIAAIGIAGHSASSQSAKTQAQPVQAPATRHVGVNFTLHGNTRNHCVQGSGGYSDIGGGTAVVIKDQSGVVLGATSLGSQPVEDGYDCTWLITVPNVPTDRAFYSAEVSHRGAVTVSKADLEQKGWTFKLELGSK